MDADGEVVFGGVSFEVVKDGDDVGWDGVFGAHAVAAADDRGGAVCAVEGAFYVEVEGFVKGSWFFGAVQDGDGVDGGRDGI